MNRVPDLNAAHVQAFATEVVTTGQLAMVRSSPRFDRPQNDCFALVKEKIATHGGSMVLGWTIWEWPSVMIEAEFHAVWRSPEGELLDLNPRTAFLTHIVFLPDQNRQYEGRQVDNYRKPWVNDQDLKRFIFIFRKQFEILNKGDLAFQHEVELPPRALKELQSLQKEGARLERRLHVRYGAP